MVPEDEMVEALVTEAKLLAEEGIDARLAAKDASAAAIAQEERIELLSVQGDANRAQERRAAVADVASGSD